MTEKSETGSVTQWLKAIADDSPQKDLAQHRLWERYFSRLTAVARSKMASDTRQAGDEEDVALCALSSFYRRANNGEFPNLSDRSGLWPLLARLTVHKTIKHVEHERAQKRGGNSRRKLAVKNDLDLPSLGEVLSKEPTPDFVAEMREQVESLLSALPDFQLREIAELKLAGHRNAEIAELTGLGLRSVERKLSRIRTLWSVQRCEE